MREYVKEQISATAWIIHEAGREWSRPQPAPTFAFDTETQTYFDGKLISSKQLLKKTKNLSNDEKRKRLSNITWAWQCYDELNGFFMTNDFETWLDYQCKCRYKFGWCYNSTFDFSQIDFEILAKAKEKWKRHERAKEGEAYMKNQALTYESIHNDMGTRYAYKLWIPYKNESRHNYVHAVEYHDFMKLTVGGLAKVLEGLDVRDINGDPIRKSTMEYQAVNTDNLTQAEIDYCRIDVEGLYFAVKKFNDEVERQSNGESHIFGKYTNIMTAGGFAKRELLRSLYPNVAPRFRLSRFQKSHPMSAKRDKFFRDNKLYRGGISYVNPRYKGKLLTASMFGEPMRRYDVNSEYPYAMSEIETLVGHPRKITMEQWQAMKDKERYEAIYALNGVYGQVKKGMLGVWYDPFKREYCDTIAEEGLHLMFEREFYEMLNWYDDVETNIEYVIIYKKGGKIYKPFVDKFYAIKAEAKKDGKPVLLAIAKLLLNSSYGKLAERIERAVGHYEQSAETGAIHYVHDETEIDEKAVMSVADGALITAYARAFILSKIREVCEGQVAKRFVYIDTDSIHAFAVYPKADAFALGGLKLEATCEAVKYILPKTYIDIERVNKDGTFDFSTIKNGKEKANYEVHSKGVNVKAITKELQKKQKGKKNNKPTLWLIDKKISYGAKYICLQAMNVYGGKILLPVEKYLARLEQAPNYDDEIIYNNYAGGMFAER